VFLAASGPCLIMPGVEDLLHLADGVEFQMH